MITAAELAEMRDDLEDSLPDLAVVKTQNWVSDGGGGGSTTFTASGTIPCRIAPVQNMEGTTGGRISPDSEYVVTLPFDAAVTTESMLTINTRNFSVTGMREPRSWEISRRIEAKEVV